MSIRLRLTLWYTAILFIALTVFMALTYLFVARSWRDQLDTTLNVRAHQAEGEVRVGFSRDNVPTALYAPQPNVLNRFSADGVYIQYTNTDGVDVSHSSNLTSSIVLTPDDIQRINAGQPFFQTIRTQSGESVRAYIYPIVQLSNSAPYPAVITAKPTSALSASLRKAQLLFAGGTIGITILLACIVYVVAAFGLRPVRRMAHDAAGIQRAQDLSRRVAVPQTHDEVAELGVTFNGMLGRLEAAFEAQRRFIADASHELRTPLTAIRGNADILRQHGDRMDPADRSEVLDEVAMEAERMSRLVNDLLSLARAQSGERTRPQPVRLNEVIDSAVRAARGLARGHDIIYMPASEHLWVLGDPDRLKQLALILLDNAIKYTPPEGHIWVSITKDAHAVELRVTDDGPGIPAERLPNLFDRFYRGGTLARGRDDGGAGLGLAIAREIAQADGGSIAVESAVGSGTAFIVTLPLLTATPLPHPADFPTASVPVASPAAPVIPLKPADRN